MNRFLSIAALAATMFVGDASAQCAATAYGTSCGPVASGAYVPNGGTHHVTATVDQATPGSSLLFIVGLQELAVPLVEFPGCFVHTDFVFHQIHRADANGHYSYSRALPSNATGTTPFMVQFMELALDGNGQLQLRATNGVRYQCQ